MVTNKRMFILTIVSFFLVSIFILLMPLSSDKAQTGDLRLLYFIGGGFWLCLLFAYILLIILSMRIKKAKNYKNIKINGSKLFKFFKNRNAKICDIILIFSSILFVISIITIDKSNYIICVLLSLIFLSLHMHFLLNSKMYHIIKNGE